MKDFTHEQSPARVAVDVGDMRTWLECAHLCFSD